ncbi:BatA domain-containing protein [Aquimarina intermedia]|uniref:Putative membrane protein (TIGR02226 family) n=1 Tax=Aquimarina intermedia TaxID=350814 RepID=A0A5S5C8Y4_9FLAO|nr:BatA domain-containing protein [Aquimarina intermedia]TYP74962.1 putative membrane protein (TIGR02226 family) [Aquimarina intermedia]
MHFKHPEFLYALFALIIPLLIHLFQLRKFQKIEFSNVQFLKAVSLQTRKSSNVKKLIILLTRMLLLACIILAFAQPFFTNDKDFDAPQELVIYLDNSFSMEAKGKKGPLLKRAVQEIAEAIPEQQLFTLFTNDEVFKEVTKKDVLNDLLQIGYSPNQLAYHTAYLKGKQFFSKNQESNKNLVLISDFQIKQNPLEISFDGAIVPKLIKLTPESKNNIAIDTLYLERNKNNDLTLAASVSSTNLSSASVPITLFDNDKLIAKSSVSFNEQAVQKISFSLKEGQDLRGKLVLQDPMLSFDNTRYLAINSPKKIKVLSISGSDDAFLKYIYTPDEFILTQSNLNALNYNTLGQSDLIILNEIETVPVTLLNALKAFVASKGVLCFIPSVKGNLKDYNELLNQLDATPFNALIPAENLITTIHFDHPLFKGVFDKKIDNFQYPKVKSYFPVNSTRSILSYTDERTFLYNHKNLYVFTASIASDKSNFKNTSLIVPVLYNVGKESLKQPVLYYQVGKLNSYDVQIPLDQDEIISLYSEQETIIPLQQNFTNKVRITTDETPTRAGMYTLTKGDEFFDHLAYNYGSSESRLKYHTLKPGNDYTVADTISLLFDELKENNRVQEFWKWFVIFALVFLLLEILLLKYLK